MEASQVAGGHGDADFVTGAAEEPQGFVEQSFCLVEMSLVGQDLTDVQCCGRRSDQVAGLVAGAAAALLEVQCFVPPALVEGVCSQVVEHVGLADEVAELLVQVDR